MIPLTVLASSTAPVARRRAMWKIESSARLAAVGRIETDCLMSQIDPQGTLSLLHRSHSEQPERTFMPDSLGPFGKAHSTALLTPEARHMS